MKTFKWMKSSDRFPVLARIMALGAVLFLAASGSPARAAENVTLAWDASPDTTVVGYLLYYGVVGGTSTNSLDAGNQLTATVSNLTAGTTVFFYATAYNAQRIESVPSNLITYTVPVANTPPTISSIANRTINEDTSTGAIGFTVGDVETAAGSLTVSGSSSNPTLVPNGNLVFGGSGANRTISVTPAANQSGTATITVTVSDGTAATSTSFALTVSPVNDPPTISNIANQTIYAGGTIGPIAFTVGDVDTALSSLTLSGSSSNPTLVPNANIVFGGSGANRTVTVTPAPAQVGTATITVTVNDGSAGTSTSFAITVNLNTAPTISAIPDQVITANTATAPILFAIGDAETPATNLTLSSSSSNPTLVPSTNIVFGGSGTNRTVTVTPAVNQSGTATITVTVSDGSITASTSFLLTVNPATAPTYVYLPLEAESAALVAPMAIAADSNAGHGQYIQSSANESGTATYSVNIPVSGDYIIWFRVLSPDSSRDSFYVSVDNGPEDIDDTVPGNLYTNSWQWSPVQGRSVTNVVYISGVAVNLRVFQLAAGAHNIVIRSREAYTKVDQLLVTNDPNYIPDVIFSIMTPPLKITSIQYDPAGFVTLTWPTVPGATYRVAYKTSLTDAAWIPLGQDLQATDTVTSRSDYIVGNRFYSVQQLP